MAVSNTVLAQAFGHGVALVVGYAASRQGLHVSPADSAEIAAVASMVVGPLFGHLVNVKSGSQADSTVSDAEKLLTVVSESGSSPRSALSQQSQQPTQSQ